MAKSTEPFSRSEMVRATRSSLTLAEEATGLGGESARLGARWRLMERAGAPCFKSPRTRGAKP